MLRRLEALGERLAPGSTAATLPQDRRWRFTPTVRAGDEIRGRRRARHGAGDGRDRVRGARPARRGRHRRVGRAPRASTRSPSRSRRWRAASCGSRIAGRCAGRARSACAAEASIPLGTGQRALDLLFPVARGSTAAVPGGFGTGKTVLLQQIAKWCDADVIVYVSCGERGNELADVLQEISSLEDPRTGRSLLDRTVLIANTSNMPLMARELSVHAGATVAELYRDMGYDALVIADSTSRWAEALREIASRTGELPAEEGYPAGLAPALASFYERAALAQTLAGGVGSVTILGAVSPPGGDMAEPVTAHTRRFVRGVWSLDRDLAYARHYPAVSWTESSSRDARPVARWHAAQRRPGVGRAPGAGDRPARRGRPHPGGRRARRCRVAARPRAHRAAHRPAVARGRAPAERAERQRRLVGPGQAVGAAGDGAGDPRSRARSGPARRRRRADRGARPVRRDPRTRPPRHRTTRTASSPRASACSSTWRRSHDGPRRALAHRLDPRAAARGRRRRRRRLGRHRGDPAGLRRAAPWRRAGRPRRPRRRRGVRGDGRHRERRDRASRSPGRRCASRSATPGSGGSATGAASRSTAARRSSASSRARSRASRSTRSRRAPPSEPVAHGDLGDRRARDPGARPEAADLLGRRPAPSGARVPGRRRRHAPATSRSQSCSPRSGSPTPTPPRSALRSRRPRERRPRRAAQHRRRPDRRAHRHAADRPDDRRASRVRAATATCSS